jgi:uncharacterized membrane protein YjfL (UPF0719 family)
MKFHFLAGFMAEALLIVLAAKVARDRVLKWRGYDVNEMVTRKRSAGAGTSQAGYLIGVVLGFLGAISARGADTNFLSVVGVVAVSGVLAIVLQLVADIASDRLIFRGVEGPKGTVEDVNVALAVGKAAVSVATGLVLRGAMSEPEAGLLSRVIWFAVAQAAMVGAVLLYFRATPYDDLAEIKRNNLAAGFPVAGILLAVGLIMEAAISRKSSPSVVHPALDAARFAGVSLLLVYVLRWVGNLIMLPKTKLPVAVVDEKNVAAGIQEGLSFLLAALIVTFFLN